MKVLIVEDDYISSRVLQKMLVPLADCHIAEDGVGGVDAFTQALQEGAPYDLICLDIMMPKMNGQEVLKRIRRIEREREVSEQGEVRIVMMTALDSPQNVIDAYFQGGCNGYLVKPIKKQLLLDLLKEYRLVS